MYDLLKAFVRPRKLGYVGHEKYLVELQRNDVEPDICFWSSAKSSTFTRNQLLFPPPDLAVEVLSESMENVDRVTKLEDYAANGVTEYWIVDASEGVVEQHVLRGDGYVLALKTGDGTLKCAAIDGAEFPVRAIFEDEPLEQAVMLLSRPSA